MISIAGAVLAFAAVSLPVTAAQDSGDESFGERAFWWVVPDLDLDEIDALARGFDVRGTYADRTLVRAQTRDALDLVEIHPESRSIGEALEGERLYSVSLRPGESLESVPFLRMLLLEESVAILAAPLDRRIDHCFIARLIRGRDGAAFHDGVAPVPLRRQSPARRRDDQSYAAGVPHDPRIQGWVDQVDKSLLQATVTTLSSYTTRRSDSSTGVQAQNWILNQFLLLGLSASLHNFDSNADNVVADYPGALDPAKVVIVGAHYDSINGSGSVAPGADDNASGTAALLEIARILSSSGASLRFTVRFIAFASEEFGLLGSDAYSQKMVNDGVDLVAMLNTDMNSYRASGDVADLDFVTTDTTGWLTDLLTCVHSVYVPAIGSKKTSLSGGTSDHLSFFLDGFPAAFYFEDVPSYSPYIHTSSDTVGTSANDFNLSRDITKSVLAGTAHLAQPLDLQIDHTPLSDSSDSYNPYPVVAEVSSLIGSNPAQATVYYDAGSGEVESGMFRTGTPDEWIGQIPAQPAGTRIQYRIEAGDDQGNVEVFPSTGSLEFLVGQRNTFYFENFEAGEGGWTHGGTEDDWQRGKPAGKSTDPATAYSGTNAFGTDIGGSGFNGEYRSNADSFLRSPSINATGRTSVHLRYARSLGVEDAVYDQAELRQNGTLYFGNPVGGGSDHFIDAGWMIHDIDLSATADNLADVRIRFELTSDGGLELGGWNVDDVELYSLASGPKPSLSRDRAFVSLSQGGTTVFSLDLGAANGNRGYAFFAGASGTSPGFDIGTAHVAVNFDAVTATFLQLGALIPGFYGQTNAAGAAQMNLMLPPGLDGSLAGLRLYFAAVTLGPSDLASNSVELLLVE